MLRKLKMRQKNGFLKTKLWEGGDIGERQES